MSPSPTFRRRRVLGFTAALAVGAGSLLIATNAQATSPAQAHVQAQTQSQTQTQPTSQRAASSTSASVSTEGKVLYTSVGDQINKVTIDMKLSDTLTPSGFANYEFTIRDRVQITAGAGCVHPTATDLTAVVCTVHEPDTEASDLTTLIVDLAGGDDRVTVAANSTAYTEIHGGAGNDIILGGGYDVLYGDAGDDRIDGGGGAYGEGAYGGPGNDILTGCDESCHQD